MRCSSVRKLLSPFLDEELSEGKSRKVRDHVSRCASCRSKFIALQNLDALSRKTLPHEPSEAYWVNFLPRLHQRIDTAPPQSSWAKVRNFFGNVLFPSHPWLRTAGAIASVVLLFFVGRAIIHDKGSENVFTVTVEDMHEKKTDQPQRIDIDAEGDKRQVTAQEDKIENLQPSQTGEEEPTVNLQRAEGKRAQPKGTDEIAGQKQKPPQERGDRKDAVADGVAPVTPGPAKIEREEGELDAESRDLPVIETAYDEISQPEDVDRAANEVGAAPKISRDRGFLSKKSIDTKEPSQTSFSMVGSDKSQWMYEQALRNQNMGKSEIASTQFKQIVQQFPRSHVADDAQFQLNIAAGATSDAPWTLERWHEQRDSWEHFLQTYPHSEFSGEACFKLAESWYQIANITQVHEDYAHAFEANQNCQKTGQKNDILEKQAKELNKILGIEKK